LVVRFDYLATKTGAIIVPSCGIDSIPSDASAFLANKALKAHGKLKSPVGSDLFIANYFNMGIQVNTTREAQRLPIVSEAESQAVL
jgi:short subunit dehydrogenase-like uncharacterized protein